MSKVFADYDKNKVIDLNQYYPSNLKNDFVDGLNENIFNRFLTKQNFSNYIGGIGSEQLSSSIKNILESSEFKQNNQLQPVLTSRVGAVDIFMSWQDFLTRMQQQGIAVDEYGEWGKALQFNWVPPIDLDKFINFRDYYWNSEMTGGTTPEYVTIKNRHIARAARLNELLKSTADTIIDNDIVASVDNVNKKVILNGNIAGKYSAGQDIIVKYETFGYDVVTITSSTFDPITVTTILEVSYISDQNVITICKFDIPSTRSVNDANIVAIYGDYTSIIDSGYILSISATSIDYKIFTEVISSSYDSSTNKTFIIVDDSLPVDVYSISLSPLSKLAYFESISENGFTLSQNYTEDTLYKILWMSKLTKVKSNRGSISLGSNTLEDISVDFTLSGVQVGDYIEFNTVSGIGIIATITSVSSNQVQFTTQDSPYIYSFSDLSYSIYSKQNSETYKTEPTSPVEGDYWLDGQYVKRYSSGSWSIVALNYGVLENSISDRRIEYIDNEWIKSNAWIHKSQIASVSGKIRAQVPIIEFDDRLILSEFVRYDYSWAYRRTLDDSFISQDKQPTLFEIINIQKTDAGLDVFAFSDNFTISLSPTYGNLSNDIAIGSKIKLTGFNRNDGVYTVANVEYYSPALNSNKQTKITIVEPLIDITDRPVGSTITPNTTSYGDDYIGPYAHWRYDGISNSAPTSEVPEKNTLYNIELNSSTTSKGGYNWQSYSFVTGAVTDPVLEFRPQMHGYCLYDDYEEGDIRVYINKIRQYGNFIELPSYIDDRFVGGIQFIGGVSLSENDVVLIEVGEYANIDAGRKAVVLNTPSGFELVNISRYKLSEQIKTSAYQYPYFSLVDSMTKELYGLASNIFTYVEDSSAEINPHTKRKLATSTNSSGTSFIFEQHLLDDAKTLAYRYNTSNGIDYSSIWKVGTRYETYAPSKTYGDNWDISNNWFYNFQHENRKVNTFIELYTHFRSIIAAQKQPGLLNTFDNQYYATATPNYGLGGTIKDHNGNLDLLAAVIFNRNVTFEELLSFAKKQYSAALFKIKSRYVDDSYVLFDNKQSQNLERFIQIISDDIINNFENDPKYSYWFGDSSSWDGEAGIKNWILTLPLMGIVTPIKPNKLIDKKLGIYQILHHDGHRSDFVLSTATIENIISNITKTANYATEIVVSDQQQLPNFINGQPAAIGDLVIRTVTTASKKSIYRFNGTEWDLLDLNEILLDCILTIENKLYEISAKNFDGLVYNFATVIGNQRIDDLKEEQFNKFTASSGVLAPLSNKDRYSKNNPFTWNYYFSVPSSLPTADSYVQVGDWRKMYMNVFGSPYPHLEPWAVQGYLNKPDWWDAEYLINGIYTNSMWNNILTGVVPLGYSLPSGDISDGTPSLKVYDYLPVVTLPQTADGYVYGDLLPPYWNSANNGGISTIRSIFDPNIGDQITSPNLDFTFGEFGDMEYIWSSSIDYAYDIVLCAFKLDPMNLISSIFGYKKYKIGCVEMHEHSRNIQSTNPTIFHGDEYNGKIFNCAGINQWYVNFNRYQDYDATNSTFASIWNKSSMKLSYEFDSLVDTFNFGIRSEIFDITNKDYSILIKKNNSIDKKRIDAIELTLLSAPSRFLADEDKGWTVELSTLTENKSAINYFGVQSYEVSIQGNEFVAFSDNLYDVKYESAKNIVRVNCNSAVSLSQEYQILFNETKTATIVVDSQQYDIVITQQDADDIDSLITAINNQLSGAYVDLELGDFVIVSTIPDATISLTDVNLFSSIPQFASITQPLTLDAKFLSVFSIKGNKTAKYKKYDKISIRNSTIFDGTYTVLSTSYNVLDDITLIEVAEQVQIPNGSLIIDGTLTSMNSLGIPYSWVTGTEIYFHSYDVVENLSTERPYYIIRTGDNTFSIAETAAKASSGLRINLSSVAIAGSLYAGRLQRTFKALGGVNTQHNWRIHEIDDRIVSGVYDGASITGMQNIVDWLHGYASYCQSIGFDVSNLLLDEDTGRPYGWDLYIEKFIDWAFIMRAERQQTRIEYSVTASADDSSFAFAPGQYPNWANGTSVLLIANDGASLPPEFVSSDLYEVPYYVIRTNSKTSIKLAQSPFDASKGIGIEFTQDSIGSITMQYYVKYESKPSFVYAPFAESVTLNHDTGISEDIFSDGSYVYDINGQKMDSSQILVNRRDKKTDISLLGIVRNYNLNNSSKVLIGGASLSIGSIEHILSLNNYSVSDDLIYDPFLGLRTPRFILDFNKDKNNTGRPTISGYVLNSNTLIPSIESSVEDSRYYYDYMQQANSAISTNLVRKSLGYDGPKDYMTSIGINDKSQFIFWKSMIQNKGTNLAVSAFTNQVGLSNADVDEFWAYKIATFGGAEKTEYPEMNLLASDTNRNDLRIEFVPPNNSALNSTFVSVALTDMDRWYKQPDQIKAQYPYDTFFFDMEVLELHSNINDSLLDIGTSKGYVLEKPADIAVISYYKDGKTVILTEQSDYYFANSRVIIFNLAAPESLDRLTIASLTYNFTAQNPSKIIDRKHNSVVSEVPFWHPAIGQYDLKHSAPIDRMASDDPAMYTNQLDNSVDRDSGYWDAKQKDFIWMDTNTIGYVPYYDKTIIPDINDRIFNWGKIADWANLEIYQWTESKLTPEEWDAAAKRQENDYTIQDSERITGKTRKILYKNNGDKRNPIWAAVNDVHVDIISGLLNEYNTPQLYGEIEVYVNGKYSYTKTMESPEDYLYVQSNLAVGTYLHFVRRAPVPTPQQLLDLEYTYNTPYTKLTTINPYSGAEEYTYYYWVYGKSNVITVGDSRYTLKQIKDAMVKTPSPYMILQGARPPGSGYGLVYGNTFDEFEFNLPYRYTQLIVKGLDGMIKDDGRYTLRFTKDFNFRDRLDRNSLKKKVLHEEWKLFREQQFAKIDRYLWEKLIESIIGFKMTSETSYDANIKKPSYNRVVYDTIYNSDTRIGLGDEQVFVDADMAMQTIQNIVNSNVIYEVTDSEREVLLSIDFSTPESSIKYLNDVYYSLPSIIVNKIFFAILYDALSKKIEYSDIMKTSWVAVQISQNLDASTNISKYANHNLIDGTPC